MQYIVSTFLVLDHLDVVKLCMCMFYVQVQVQVQIYIHTSISCPCLFNIHFSHDSWTSLWSGYKNEIKSRIRHKHLYEKISIVDVMLLNYGRNGNVTPLLPDIAYIDSNLKKKIQKWKVLLTFLCHLSDWNLNEHVHEFIMSEYIMCIYPKTKYNAR